MRLDKLAITAQEAFQNSMGVASDAESAVIQPIHLLKALLGPEVAGRHAHADAGQ